MDLSSGFSLGGDDGFTEDSRHKEASEYCDAKTSRNHLCTPSALPLGDDRF